MALPLKLPQVPDMLRPRLKTSFGCDNCRVRRKKCNEAKPDCSSCQRLGMRCKYSVPAARGSNPQSHTTTKPDADDVPSRILRVAATRSPRTIEAAKGFQVFTSQIEFDFVMATPVFLRSTINQPCGPQSRDFSCLTTASLQVPWLRSAFYSYAAVMLSMKPEAEASHLFKSYNDSIRQLRLKLVAGFGKDDLLPILISANTLAILEIHGFARPSFAMAHLIACAQLLKCVTAEELRSAEKSIRSFYRTVAEHCIYSIASLSIFHPMPKKLISLIDWTCMSNILDSPYHQCWRPLRLQSQSLAELPSFCNINRLLLVVVVLSRDQNSSECHHNELLNIREELDVLESQLPIFYGSDVRADTIQTFCVRWQAIIHAVRILVEKLLNPWICSATKSIRYHMQECIRHLVKYKECLQSHPEVAWPPPFSKLGLGSNRNITVHWLYLIIVSAAYTLEEIKFALPFLSEPTIWGDSAHFCQTQNFIHTVKLSHNFPDMIECDGKQTAMHNHPHDGLNLLISSSGPFSTSSQ